MDLSKKELRLLLCLETCEVDYGGLVDSACLNKEEFEIMRVWNDQGFVKSGRVSSDSDTARKYWCELSSEAWRLAHNERKARSDRIKSTRKWKKTEEL